MLLESSKMACFRGERFLQTGLQKKSFHSAVEVIRDHFSLRACVKSHTLITLTVSKGQAVLSHLFIAEGKLAQ